MKEKSAIVAVIDGGGRGSALVHKYSQSSHVKKIIAIPGNDLMQINSRVPVATFPKLETTSVSEIVRICKKYEVDLVDVAQDNAVEAGLADKLIEQGFNVVGPTRAAGQIEWDKAWARDFMKKYKIPTPVYKVFKSQKDAIRFINKQSNQRWFVKAAGLAEGKGAIPAENKEDAIHAIRQMSKFGKAGKTLVIEEWLDGEEFSIFAISDGKTFQIVGSAQDHKRLYDGDQGPNTGGIGCSTPPLVVNKNAYKQAETIIKKASDGLKKEEKPYKGILYLGAIVVRQKVFVIEFNARWGDPEAEVIIPGIKNDLFELGMAIAEGRLRSLKIEDDGKVRVAVAGVSKGYPRDYSQAKGKEIKGFEDARKVDGITLYGAAVKIVDGRYYADGGRLFYVVGEGEDIIQARERAYEAMDKISIEEDNLHYRTDIGWRDVERLRQSSV